MFVFCSISIYYVDIVEVVGSSPIDPTKLQWELVALLGTASKEAVFLLFIEFFAVLLMILLPVESALRGIDSAFYFAPHDENRNVLHRFNHIAF